MASNRPIRLDDWGITWERYKELQYFCLQYEQKRQKADALLTLPVSTPEPVKFRKHGREYAAILPRGGGWPGDPVAKMQQRRERLLNDTRMIERACEQAAIDEAAGPEAARILLAAVTRKGGVQAVMRRGRINGPRCGERQFYALRRRFFVILDGMKGE